METRHPQRALLQKLLRHVWRHSSFYRDYYGSHGITEEHLDEMSVSDLPFLSKRTLMENFDAAVTDPYLKKAELERWIQDNSDPGQNFRKDFIVIHSSGSSGAAGIFVCDQKAWQIASSSIAARLREPENYPSGKTRVAFYLASHGHRGGVSTAARMPKHLYDTLILSLLDSSEHVVQQLNAFQPHRLQGYSSSISMLAEMALQGKLRIHPKRIFASGDQLTDSMERKILEAWKAPIYLLYSSAESKYIAFKETGQDEMAVLEDLNIVEVLDENNRPGLPGEEGRVVLTNLYNYTLPILRYELGDYAVLGKMGHEASVIAIRDIKGRIHDALPVVLDNGQQSFLHPLGLRIYVPGLEKIQFISLRPNLVCIVYVGKDDLEAPIRKQFQRMLDLKRASRTTFEVKRVENIANDPETGKLRRVKIKHDQLYDPSGSVEVRHPERPKDIRRIAPTNPFVRFRKEEVEQSVPQRFEHQVSKCGRRIAVRTKRHSLSYNALNKAANRTARAILDLRGEREEPVALLLDHDAPMLAAIVGVLKAGKICVPLDSSLPEKRVKYLLRDSQAALIVTNNENLSSANGLVQEGHLLMNLDEIDPRFSDENLGLTISPDTLGYIIYTSGSTGEPKGVTQNHRNILHNALRYTNGLHISRDDSVTLLAFLGTGQGVPTAFCTLLNGATLCLFNLREEGITGLANWLMAEEITVYISASTVFRHLIRTLTGRERFPKLRLIRLGAEQVRKSDVELYRKHFAPRCLFGVTLSATESGNYSHYFMDHETEITGETVPVRYAAEDMKILLLDDDGREIAFNEIGEITVKSRYLSPGYWRNPDLTATVFLPDPKGGEERIYRTGDLGLMRPDGCLVHRGRKRFTVKIRGFRVELEEIEILLSKHPGVREAVVDTAEDELGDNRLIAYVVGGEEPSPPTELRKFLRDHLPAHMVPSTFVFLEALPLTSVGKVDRNALPRPQRTQRELQAASAPPRNRTEEELVRIWTEVLSLDQIGIHDNFLDLGGHSLAATQVISRTIERFNLELPLRVLFESPTVAEMAEVIDHHQSQRLKHQ